MNAETSAPPQKAGPAPPLRLEFWPLDRLLPSPRNARTHTDAQVAEIAGSIRAFGFTNPILAGTDGDVIAGHGRLAAARRLGLAEVPVIALPGLSELQRRQLVLADNRIALNAGWDLEMLQLELKDLSALGADLQMLGFSGPELARALQPGSAGLTDENEVPQLAEQAVTARGDTWCLGPHRMVCGDSTDPQTVVSVLGPDQPRLMVTDPPYGVNYDPTWRHRAGSTAHRAPARPQTMELRAGRRPGRCFRATSPMSGTAHCTPPRWRTAWSGRASSSAPRSSGPRNGW